MVHFLTSKIQNTHKMLLASIWVDSYIITTKPSFTCSKLTIETLEQGVRYVQS